jgi:hypothetical protein
MKTGRALLLLGMLALPPISSFGASYSFPPNPIGEKLWHAQLRSHALFEMLPLAVILSALLLASLFNWAQRKGKKLAPDDTWSYEI